MIYIVAHGTVNGYQKIPSTIIGGGEELSVLTDIRTEFDNTNTMLTKQPGYLLQMSPTGVWISIAKPFIDGERSGNGAGFFAFSLFLPKEIQIEGKKIKEVLDDLMGAYLTMCPGFMTRNINVDWSFVAEKAKELSGYSKQRIKNINIDCSQSNKFAYVIAENDERVIQFLDKPFQFEFGSFKAVFIGTHLQHPMRLTMQEKIDIDFEDELYDIVWKGDVGAWPNLERKVRKKEIATKSRFFEKKYYHSEEVKFLEGTRDENNTTLTLEIPKLTPEINELKLTYIYPEAVKSIRVDGQNKDNKDILSFRGDEFAKQIRISLDLAEGYRCKDIFITPSECIGGIYNLDGIIKMKKVYVFIRWGNSGLPCENKDFEIKRKGEVEKIDLKSEGKGKFWVWILENEDFEQNYDILLTNVHYKKTSLGKFEDGYYVLDIEERQQYNNSNRPSVIEKQKFYIETKIKTEKINVNYGSIYIKRSNGTDYIEILKGTDINTIDFRLKSNNKKLKVEIKENLIILSRPFVFEFDFDWKNILVGIVIVLATIFLSIVTLFALDLANIVDIKSLMGKKEIVHSFPEPNNNSSFNIECVKSELDTVLYIQRERWIYKEIKPWVEKYKDNDSVKMLESYKELSWLMESRLCFDGYYMNGDSIVQYSNSSAYGGADGKTLLSSWCKGLKDLETSVPQKKVPEDIAKFFKQIVDAGYPKHNYFFQKYIKDKTEIEDKTLKEVKGLWEKAMNEYNSSIGNGGNGNRKGSEQQPQNSTSEELDASV